MSAQIAESRFTRRPGGTGKTTRSAWLSPEITETDYADWAKSIAAHPALAKVNAFRSPPLDAIGLIREIASATDPEQAEKRLTFIASLNANERKGLLNIVMIDNLVGKSSLIDRFFNAMLIWQNEAGTDINQGRQILRVASHQDKIEGVKKCIVRLFADPPLPEAEWLTLFNELTHEPLGKDKRAFIKKHQDDGHLIVFALTKQDHGKKAKKDRHGESTPPTSELRAYEYLTTRNNTQFQAAQKLCETLKDGLEKSPGYEEASEASKKIFYQLNQIPEILGRLDERNYRKGIEALEKIRKLMHRSFAVNSSAIERWVQETIEANPSIFTYKESTSLSLSNLGNNFELTINNPTNGQAYYLYVSAEQYQKAISEIRNGQFIIPELSLLFDRPLSTDELKRLREVYSGAHEASIGTSTTEIDISKTLPDDPQFVIKIKVDPNTLLGGKKIVNSLKIELQTPDHKTSQYIRGLITRENLRNDVAEIKKASVDPENFFGEIVAPSGSTFLLSFDDLGL